MNRKHFLSLVNLYLDEEITPEQRRKLENALRHHSEYRQLFNQYRRLNNASHFVFERTKEQKVKTAIPQKYSSKNLTFLSQLKWPAGLGIAALLTVFFSQNHQTAQPSQIDNREFTVSVTDENEPTSAVLPYRIRQTLPHNAVDPSLLLLSSTGSEIDIHPQWLNNHENTLTDWLSFDLGKTDYSMDSIQITSDESPFIGY